MVNDKRYILLNAGTKTRNAFIRGLGDAPFSWYHTKNMLLHIDPALTPHFIYRNSPIDWDNARVFTRLRATDKHFVGMLYDYFAHRGIEANDPVNLSYTERSEKIAQMLTLALYGIRIPETFIFREESYKKNRVYLKEHLAFPAIYKTNGSRGLKVSYVDSLEALDKLILKKEPYERALVQPFIENTFDTRTIVAFGTILGSIKRTRTQGYLNNIAQGAIPSRYELTTDEQTFVQNVARITQIDIAGVDCIHTSDGPVVLEVNKSPQVRGFESVFGISVFEKVGMLLREQ